MTTHKTYLDPVRCPDCIYCMEHRDLSRDGDVYSSDLNESICEFCKPGEPCEECRDPADHDVALCGCPVWAPCGRCLAACSVDEDRRMQAELKMLRAGIRSLIERNGFCVVCERYAPMHMVSCPMGR
jgi:hypothetical protein